MEWVQTDLATQAASCSYESDRLVMFALRLGSFPTSVEIAVPLGTFSFSVQTPAVASGSSVGSPLKAFSLTGQVPAAGSGADIEPPTHAFSLTEFASAVGVGASAESPLAALTLSGYALTPATGAAVAPSVNAFSRTGYAPPIASGAQVSLALAPVGVNFDGSSFALRGGDLTGASTSETKLTLSVWLKSTAGSSDYIFRSTGLDDRISLFRGSDGDLTLVLYNNIETAVWRCVIDDRLVGSDWNHLLVGVDMDLTSDDQEIWLNGVDRNSELVTFTSGETYSVSSTDWGVGVRPPSFGEWAGDIADLYINVGVNLAASAADRACFYKNGWTFLGANGELPSGSSPIIFMSGRVADWHTNKGTGGGFTEIGTLAASSTNPTHSLAKGFSFSGTVPGVAAGASVSAPRGVYTINGSVPLVGKGVAVVSPLHAFTFEGFAPAAIADPSSSADVPVQAFSQAGLIPIVEAGASAFVPGHSLALSGLNPRVGTSKLIAASLKSFLLSGLSPTVSSRAWELVSEDVDTWTLSSQTTSTWAAKSEASGSWADQSESTDNWTDVTERSTTWTRK